jgi:hypothetical protein
VRTPIGALYRSEAVIVAAADRLTASLPATTARPRPRLRHGESAQYGTGTPLLLNGTIFDPLNANAAIFACEQVFDEDGVRLPVRISGTITDLSSSNLAPRNSLLYAAIAWKTAQRNLPKKVRPLAELWADLGGEDQLVRFGGTSLSCPRLNCSWGAAV